MDRFILPKMPVDELDYAIHADEKEEMRLNRMLIMHYDPRQFFQALAAANFARYLYGGSNVDRN
jgi:hypothetical protein